LALTALLASAGPAPAQPAPAQPAPAQPAKEGCTRHEAAFAPLLGRPEAEVRVALAGMPGIGIVRAGGPSAPMTSDHRPDRATLLLRPDGTVQQITCG
jgi:hypothetical protein